MAQEKKVLRKYDFDITDSEGSLNVEIPDDVVVNANSLWEDFLIGKFLDTAPHIARIHAVVNKMWRDGGKGKLVEVYEVDSTTMKFRVEDPAMRARILKRGMWNISNIPLVVTKWTPDELKEKPEVTSIPLWVHLKNVPMNMFSWQGLSFITSAVGHPVKLHPETASCSNFKLAKIFVKADLSKTLPKKINFTKNGKSSLVEFIYPGLPARCNTCGKWGHMEKVCIMNKKEESLKTVREIIEEGYVRQEVREEVTSTEEDPEKSGSKIDNKGSEVEQNGRKVEKNGSEVEQNGDEDEHNGSVTEENGNEVDKGNEVEKRPEEEIEEGEVTKEWAEVTPGKTSRSPKIKALEYGQVKIATPSRYSALVSADDNGNLISMEEDSVTEVMPKEVSTLEVGEQTSMDAPYKESTHERNKESTGSTRPSLPRNSKTFHKVIPEQSGIGKGNPNNIGKRSSRKSSQ